jgi:hypothetical protein
MSCTSKPRLGQSVDEIIRSFETDMATSERHAANKLKQNINKAEYLHQ